MLWLLAGAALIAVLWFMLRKPNKRLPYANEAEFGDFARGLRSRGATLSESERQEMVVEARRMALVGYDRLFEGALKAGKTRHFAHQAGVLDAAFCVLANDDAMRTNDGVRAALQRETVPFNVTDEHDGRSAIAEYLVWKIFPDDADLSEVMPTIDAYVDKVIEDARSEPHPDAFVDLMLAPGRFDWEELTKRSRDSAASRV